MIIGIATPLYHLQGPEIRTGMLVDAKPIQLTSGQVSHGVALLAVTTHRLCSVMD